MKKYLKRSIVLVLPVIVLICIICFNKEKKQLDDYINISELSDEFINEYFEEISNADSDEEKENMLIVISDSTIKDSYGAKNVIEAPNHQYILQYDSVEEKQAALEELKHDKRIESVEENEVRQIEEVTYNSWGINKMSLDYAIDNSNVDNLEEVTVAIIDTGLDISLFNKYYGGRLAGYYNVLEQSNTIMNDTNGHGTHVAGTIAEGTPSNVKILPIKASTNGSLYTTDIIAAINYITIDKKADVINMSFGGYGKSKAEEQAIEAAKQKNIISVAAAGNDNTSKDHYPSSFDNTIAISSVDSQLKKSSFSNYGSEVTFAAPGTNIKSIMSSSASISQSNGNSDGDDDHETISGTSMATPHAVASVAILKGYNKNLTLDNVIDILKSNSIDLGEEGWDQYYGYGLISFKDVQFCDKTHCDEYGVYKDLTKIITEIEFVNLVFTDYNYYSLTNIMGSTVRVHYSDETTEESLLSDLPALQVLNYSPESTTSQTITIKVGDFSTNVDITNPSNYTSAWEYETLSNGNIKITGYRNNGLNLNRLYVPETIDSKKVESFADNIEFSEFSDFDYYEYLYLPSYFKRIGNYSLSNTNIKYVYGDSSGVEIGSHGFESSKIETIDIVITKVESYGFKDCFKLKSVDVSGTFNYISASNTEIGRVIIEEYAFYNCKELSIVRHSKYDTVFIGTLGSHAFYNCISLSNFELEISQDIEEYAFYNTFVLTDINLYQSDSIGQYAFYGSGITEANLGLIDVVQPSSFENCKNLKSVEITSGRIESRAFWNSGLENIYIGGQVTYISDDAFAYSPLKNSIGIQSDATKPYRLIHNLGVIDNSNNKLIVGFSGYSGTEIADYVTEIGDYAFTGNINIKKITIPDTVQKIGQYAFQDCYALENVYMLGNSISFYDNTFKRTYEGDVKDTDLFIYVHKNAALKQTVIDKNLNYRHIEPDEIVVSNAKTNYTALQSVTIDDLNSMNVKLIYHEEEDREEILQPISYNNNNGIFSNWKGLSTTYARENDYRFNYGDKYYVLNAYNSLGYLSTQNVEVTVEKATPTYTVPTGLTADFGQQLSEINLPEHFEWMDGSQIITESGEVVYKAKYVPTDTNNYETIENIDITITVGNSKTIVSPEIVVGNKTYDGTTNIPTSNITVSNLESSEYSIVSAISSSADAGERNATIVLRLSNEKFEDYMFDNGKQEKEFTVNFQIIKANINITDSSKDVTVVYDGKFHNIQMGLVYEAGAIVKYMDDNNEYTLDEIPKYKAVGTYVTKYKVYINDNYNDYYGQNTLTIVEDFDYKINNYSVDENKDYISNIDINTEVNSFTPNFILGYGYGIDVDYKTINNRNVLYTGGKTRITHGLDTYKEFTNIVSGDTNGDGKINYLDYVKVYNHIQKVKHPELNKQLLENVYLIAGDISGDNKISYLDYVKIYNKIKELKGDN